MTICGDFIAGCTTGEYLMMNKSLIPVFGIFAVIDCLASPVSFQNVQPAYDCVGAQTDVESAGENGHLMTIILNDMDLITIDQSAKKRCLIDYQLQMAPNRRLQSIEASIDATYSISADNAARITVSQRVNLGESSVSDRQKSPLYGNPSQGAILNVANKITAEQLGDAAAQCGALVSIQTAVYAELALGTPMVDASSSLILDGKQEKPHPIAKVITAPCEP
jgi:hypothetical protein